MRLTTTYLFAAAALISGPAAFAGEGKALLRGTELKPEIEGEITVRESPSGLVVQGSLKDAPPGLHGFHIHEFGDCSDKGNGAGSHYNPKGVQHGNWVTDGAEGAHAGDLGNIKVAEDGTASWLYTLPGLTLSEGPTPIAGRAFIVHENPDDFGQPVGNAGGRIACGPIVLAKPGAGKPQ